MKVTLSQNIFSQLTDGFLKKIGHFFSVPQEKNNIKRRDKQMIRFGSTIILACALAYISPANFFYMVGCIALLASAIYLGDFFRFLRKEPEVSAVSVLYFGIQVVLTIVIAQYIYTEYIGSLTSLMGQLTLYATAACFIYHFLVFLIFCIKSWRYQDQ